MTAPLTQHVTVKRILDMTNAIRANPSSYAARIQTLWKDQISGANCNHAQWNIQMNECTGGVPPAVNEAINFLQNQTPVGPLTLGQGTTLIAFLHSIYLFTDNEGNISHVGPSVPVSRVTLEDRWNIYNTNNHGGLGESILKTDPIYRKNEEEALLSFIIDDGVINRENRKNIFDPIFKSLGIGIYKQQDNSGIIRDMVTMFFSGNQGICAVCASPDASFKELMDYSCWTNAAAGSLTCDPQDLSGNNNNGNGAGTGTGSGTGSSIFTVGTGAEKTGPTGNSDNRIKDGEIYNGGFPTNLISNTTINPTAKNSILPINAIQTLGRGPSDNVKTAIVVTAAIVLPLIMILAGVYLCLIAKKAVIPDYGMMITG